MISEKPHRYAVALSGSLDEVETYHRALYEHANHVCIPRENVDSFRRQVEEEFIAPLREELRNASTECEELLKQRPRPYHEDWTGAAKSLLMIFNWAVGRSE